MRPIATVDDAALVADPPAERNVPIVVLPDDELTAENVEGAVLDVAVAECKAEAVGWVGHALSNTGGTTPSWQKRRIQRLGDVANGCGPGQEHEHRLGRFVKFAARPGPGWS